MDKNLWQSSEAVATAGAALRVEIFRKSVIVIICLPMVCLTGWMIYSALRGGASWSGGGKAVFWFLSALVVPNLPYLILLGYAVFIRKLTPGRLSILWPLLIVLTGALLIPSVGYYTYGEFTRELQDEVGGNCLTGCMLASIYQQFKILFLQILAAVATILLSNMVILANILVQKAMTPEFWFGNMPKQGE